METETETGLEEVKATESQTVAENQAAVDAIGALEDSPGD
jgi:hypothetical protein